MPVLDQDIRITYGSLVMGGPAAGTDYYIDTKVELNENEGDVRVSFEVVISGDGSTATMLTREATFLDSVNRRDQRLLVELSATSRFDFNPAQLSGYGIIGTPRKSATQTDTLTAVRYDVEFNLRVPERDPARLGRREALLVVTENDACARVATFQGRWTALPGVGPTTAQAAFDANFSAYALAQLALLSPVAAGWNPLTTSSEALDELGGEIEFGAAFEEIILGESVGIVDDPDIRSQRLSVTVAQQSRQSSEANAIAPLSVTAVYSAAICKDTTTDLRTKWATTILPHILDQIGRTGAFGTVVLDEAAPSFNLAQNRIEATVRVRVFGGDLIEADLTTIDFLDHGKVFLPRADGVPHSYRQYQGPARQIRTIVSRRITRAGQGNNPNPSPILRLPGARGGGARGSGEIVSIQAPGGFEVLTEESVPRSFFVGVPGFQTPLIETTETLVALRVDEVG